MACNLCRRDVPGLTEGVPICWDCLAHSSSRDTSPPRTAPRLRPIDQDHKTLRSGASEAIRRERKLLGLPPHVHGARGLYRIALRLAGALELAWELATMRARDAQAWAARCRTAEMRALASRARAGEQRARRRLDGAQARALKALAATCARETTS